MMDLNPTRKCPHGFVVDEKDVEWRMHWTLAQSWKDAPCAECTKAFLAQRLVCAIFGHAPTYSDDRYRPVVQCRQCGELCEN